jgi:hypothetical protein
VSEQDSENPRPVLKLVRGNATEEELAALVAVLAAMGNHQEEQPPRPGPEWAAPHRKTRTTLPHGPGGWRSSGLPR